jgi:hypothetical protein
MKINNQKDFGAGVMFIMFGTFFAGFGSQQVIGTASKMGPGYFPTTLGVILILFGIAISVCALSKKATDEKIEKFDWRGLFLIIGSTVLFGFALRRLGLIVSLFILIAISSYASPKFSWKSTLINILVLIIICLTVFVWGLKLEFQLWPYFISN